MGRRPKDEDAQYCCVCNKDCEVIYMFGPYGNNDLMVKDNNEYCKEHFEEKEREYARAFGESS